MSDVFNQEDSVTFNQHAIDLGFMRTTRVKTYTHVGAADATVRMLPMGTTVDRGDPLLAVGDTTIIHEGTVGRLNAHEVRAVPEGIQHIVTVTETRIPQVGDKFASRSAQKSTIGVCKGKEDMPFTADGLVPDIIVNPHAIPSRMTISHLFEAMWGKTLMLDGTFGDGTTFAKLGIDEICERLRAHGYDKLGNEVFYSPYTGKPMRALYVGEVYYQVLRHMVADKAAARGTGPVDAVTRQPCEGRKRGGGLRCGEMERDCIISHGASSVLLDRLLKSSDQYAVRVCTTCGRLGTSDWAGTCKCGGGTNTVNIPYPAKLLTQEIQGMGISIQYDVQ